MMGPHTTTRILFANPNALPLSRPNLVDRFTPTTTTTSIGAGSGTGAAVPVLAPAKAKHAINCSSPSSPDTNSYSPTSILYCSNGTSKSTTAANSTAAANSTRTSTHPVDIIPARTVAITGASGGIGLETVKNLVETLPNLRLLILCVRDVKKTERTVAALPPLHACVSPHDPGATGADLEQGRVGAQGERIEEIKIKIVPVNLSDSFSIISCIDDIYDILQDTPLDLLICNAGVMACPLDYSTATISISEPAQSSKPPPQRESQKQKKLQNALNRARSDPLQSSTGMPTTRSILTKIESQYFINFLSHALLTDRLLPSLQASEAARVVFVSSLAVAISKGRASAPTVVEKNYNNVTDGNYRRWNCYGDSKLAMSLFARALSDRDCGAGVEFVSLHPGIVQTELARHILQKWAQFRLPDPIAALFGLISPQQGAKLSLELAKALPHSLESGAMYTGVGGKQASANIIPLLQNQQAVDDLYNDTKAFLDSI